MEITKSVIFAAIVVIGLPSLCFADGEPKEQSSLLYSEKIVSEGYIVTYEALREFIAAGPEGDIRSSTQLELAKAPHDRPNYLILRFNHPAKQHLSGEVAVSLTPANGKPQRYNISIHIGDYWRDYFIPLDSWAWRPVDEPPVVAIEWTKISLQ